jgi:hypothetical protein
MRTTMAKKIMRVHGAVMMNDYGLKIGAAGNCGLVQIPIGRWNGSLIGPQSAIHPPIDINERAKQAPNTPPPLLGEGDPAQ